MLKIRLRRMGSRHRPFYRVVVSDSHRTPTATALEEVGYYNPRTQPVTLNLKIDRVEHWMSHGAQPSSTVRKLVAKAKAAPAEPVVAEAVVAETPAVEAEKVEAVEAEAVEAEAVAEDAVAEDAAEATVEAKAGDAAVSEPTADEAAEPDDATAEGEAKAKTDAETAAEA